MHNLLRTLILLMIIGVLGTVCVALGWINSPLGHIRLAIIVFLFTIFAQAFCMFYFIGVARFCLNILEILNSEANLNELFDVPPKDLTPYRKKTLKFAQDSDRCKRQTVPWAILMLVLGTIAFLLGGAHDTGLVNKTTHSGVVYGFLVAMIIGFFRQWYYLGVSNITLRKIKTLFSIPDAQM